jgi:hypothetical protein
MNPRGIIGPVIALILTVFFLDRYLNWTRITPPILRYYNEKFGALNVPNLKYLKVKESLFLGETNYDGRFRENYPKRRADPGTLRIILIGDSFVEGIDVLSRNHFASHMERLLGEGLGRKVEVLNFGRGNCTLQSSSYYYLNHIKKEYDADLVLYFTESRDLEEVTNYPSTSFLYDSARGDIAESTLWKEATDYKLTAKLQEMGIMSGLNASGWFRLLYRARSGIQMYGFLPKVLGKFYGEIPSQSYERKEVEVSLSKTSERIFDTLRKETNPPVWFVLRNFPFESTRLAGYMANTGFNYIDLSDTLDFKVIKGTNDDAYFFKTTGTYGGHWNHLGHIAIGHFLSNRLLTHYSRGRIRFRTNP